MNSKCIQGKRVALVPLTRSSKKKKSWIARSLMLALLSVIGFIGYHLASPAIAGLTMIQHVSISGANNIERREVLSLLGLSPNSTLMSLDLSILEQQLEQHPWVASASVGRALPHTLTVVIVERQPAALFKHDSGKFFLDEKGVILSIASDQSPASFPTLVGMSTVKLLQGDLGIQERARMGIALSRMLQARFEDEIRIDLSNSQGVTAQVGLLTFQFTNDFTQSWQQYLNLESTMHEKFPPKQSEIDLRYTGKVIVRQRV